MPTHRSPFVAAVAAALSACGGTPPEPAEPPAPRPPAAPTAAPSASSTASREPAAAQPAERQPPPPSPPPEPAKPASPCPADMVFVDTTYCSKVRTSCRNDEYSKPNKITICHEFAPGQVCVDPPRRQRYCIDKYEFPNQAGAHPPVMVDWYDGMAACKARGKRLCWESEWVAACEGPDKLPFPHGLRRDPNKCNIDNVWLEPSLDAIYSPKPEVHGPELARLDQSFPSGAKAGCVSGFGVHDLTGNLDEWVTAERNYPKSKWAGLKGGAWGHVRNACRPMTTSHPPEFSYYFISFRCCADAAPDPEADKDPTLWRPPPMPDPPDPGRVVSPGWTPRPR